MKRAFKERKIRWQERDTIAQKQLSVTYDKQRSCCTRGQTVAEICRHLGISDATYYKWHKEYGGMQISQAKRLKELERENSLFKKAVADLTVDKLILQEVVLGK